MATTSTVCLIAKNEAPYLIEWLAYYRVLGFNEVVIYENNSSDNSKDILKKLAGAGKVVHRTWKLGRSESPQITAYIDALRRVKSEWILFVDADEFLVLHQHETVNQFLETFKERKEIGAIGVNWRLFGDSHLEREDDRPVTERFTLAAGKDFEINRHIKSFTRVATLGKVVHMHACDTTAQRVYPSGAPMMMPDWGLSEYVEFDVAQINHYYTKTGEEYQRKKLRGQGGAGDNKPELKYWYNDESFQVHNRNDVEDKAILKLSDKIKAEMEQLNALIK